LVHADFSEREILLTFFAALQFLLPITRLPAKTDKLTCLAAGSNSSRFFTLPTSMEPNKNCKGGGVVGLLFGSFLLFIGAD
jgi:hypothetical protein